MVKTKRIMLSVAILVAVLASMIALIPLIAEGSAGTYMLTLRFRDDIQVTYEINYPTRGVWTGAEDVPIGGTALSSQVYCADPYIPFHLTIPNYGGWTIWDWPYTVDRIDGYVSGVPWAYSGAMSKEGDLVNWIVVNGYRGDFIAHDRESQESVTRLQSMFPAYAGSIDKTVAMMATKVAIWKVLAGDDVKVVATSLEPAGGTSARRQAFDVLVDGLVALAKAGATGYAPPVTTFDIALDKTTTSTPGTATVVGSSYDVYGPYTITANLIYGTSSNIRAYLKAEGRDSNGIFFAESAAAASIPPTANIYGTQEGAHYIDLTSGDPKPFYMYVPNGRSGGDDNLTIKAMAGALSSTVEEGTPVTFLYVDAGVQSWSTIQAFVGGAKANSRADLYAEAIIRTVDSHGRIHVSKLVDNATPLDVDAEFTFQVLHENTGGGLPSSGMPVDLSEYPVYGAYSVDYTGNTFTLKHGGSAYIDGLPADGNDYYWVQETGFTNAPPGFSYTYGHTVGSATAITLGGLAGPFQINPGTDTGVEVTFYNSRTSGGRNTDDLAFLWVGKAALDNLALGRHIVGANGQEVLFEFILESSADNGATWAPVSLDSSNINDTRKIVPLGGPQGRFRLSTTQAAFFELDHALEYRVTELDPGPEYSYITFATRLYDRNGMTYDESSERVVPIRWNGEDYGAIAADGLRIDRNHQLRLAFGNYRLNTYDLVLSKNTAGNVSGDKLFQFRIIFMRPDEHGNLVPMAAVPFGLTSTPNSWAVSGVTADRLSGEANTILSLKGGESATIYDLMEGFYVIEEITTGYRMTYRVNGGSSLSASGGATDVINLDGDVRVSLTNRRAPQTGDERNPTPAILMLIAGVGCIAGAEVYRRRKKRKV